MNTLCETQNKGQTRGQVTEAVDCLQRELDTCEAQASMLAEKLSAVLGPENPSEGVKDAAAYEVPLAKVIQLNLGLWDKGELA